MIGIAEKVARRNVLRVNRFVRGGMDPPLELRLRGDRIAGFVAVARLAVRPGLFAFGLLAAFPLRLVPLVPLLVPLALRRLCRLALELGTARLLAVRLARRFL